MHDLYDKHIQLLFIINNKSNVCLLSNFYMFFFYLRYIAR